jgi:hypothetical protein
MVDKKAWSRPPITMEFQVRARTRGCAQELQPEIILIFVVVRVLDSRLLDGAIDKQFAS